MQSSTLYEISFSHQNLREITTYILVEILHVGLRNIINISQFEIDTSRNIYGHFGAVTRIHRSRVRLLKAITAIEIKSIQDVCYLLLTLCNYL